MTLQYTLESIDNLDEATQKLYIPKDGKYVLDVTGHEKPDDNKDKIPLSRLNQEIEKRKLNESQLEEIANGFVESVPEEMRDLIPDLPHGQKIKWIQNAAKKGLFDPKNVGGIDTKRPKEKPPADFTNMDPRARMASGYKTK